MKRIRQCLNPRLIEICENSIQLEILNQKIKDHLPDPIQAHCRVGSFRQGSLTLIASNANWASQLRYMLPELRDKLRCDGFYQLTSIKMTVSAHPGNHQTTSQPALAMSSMAKNTILDAAQHCDYEPLQAALLHLARNVEP